MFAYVLECMLTLAKMQKKTVLYEKVRSLKAEHFERYSSFSYCAQSSYCTQSSIYLVF